MKIDMDPLQKQMLDDVFDAFTMLAPGSIVSLVHVTGGVTRYSAAGVELFGLPGEYIPNGAMDWVEWIHPEDRKMYLDVMMPLIEGTSQSYDLTYRVRTVTGEYNNFHLVGSVLRDESGNPSLIGGAMFNEGLTRDVDPVTVLPNRSAYQADLTEYMGRGEGAYSLMVGMSNFSQVNQVHGYSFGNRVLQETAWLIQEAVGERGKVYRCDGATFAIVSATVDRKEMAAIYDHIRYQLQRGIEVNGTTLTFAANGGLISTFSSSVEAASVYTSLVYAYNESKEHMHGDLVDFNGSISYERVESLELVNALRESAAAGCRGFRMEYQPVVAAQGEQVNGAEAVIVWEDERFGKVEAQDFVHLLERDFMFEEIGDFILERSFEDGVKLLEAEPNFLLCINVYRIQLDEDYFVDNLLYYLNQSGFPSKQVSVKFDSACRNIGMDRMREIIDKLHAHDILVIIGDFGSGTDSIGFLKSEPVDAVSIEGEFVGEILDDAKEHDVLAHLADIAGNYVEHINVKGIDNAELRDAAAQLNVTTLQGEYYAGSLTYDELVQKCYSK